MNSPTYTRAPVRTRTPRITQTAPADPTEKADLENALWALHEFADLIANAALVSGNAAWRLQQDEQTRLRDVGDNRVEDAA